MPLGILDYLIKALDSISKSLIMDSRIIWLGRFFFCAFGEALTEGPPALPSTYFLGLHFDGPL